MLARFSRVTALLVAGLLAASAHAQLASTPCPAPVDQPRMVLVPYQVAELVIPVGSAGTAPDKAGKPEKTAATRVGDLIKTIQDTIAPKSWASHGGRGTIDYFPTTMTLVVNQTPDVQEQVADLLKKLRREQNTEVALEVRLVTLPEGFFERLDADSKARGEKIERLGSVSSRPWNAKIPPDRPSASLTPASPPKAEDLPSSATRDLKFLNDTQVFYFLEAVQGDQRADVMQAPKITLLNNQMGQVDCTDKQRFVTGAEVVQRDERVIVVPKTEEVVTGFRMSACPKVSADRRSVLLNLDVNQTDLASPAVPLTPVTVQIKDSQGKPLPFTQYLQQPKLNTIHIEKTLTIPDGGTVLLGGLTKVNEVRTEHGPPVLSNVPYVNRLFTNIGYGREAQTVYVLVTPRVIVNEEGEQRPPVCAPCKTARLHGEMVPVGGTEESEATDHSTKALAELLKAYDEACVAGHTKEAARFARAALTLDPTCFSKARGR
jgi:type II secretory pathway component GspD/PulD (secretin)